MPKPSVLIMAGGTGGHVFPALAVADELIRQGFNVHWLGTVRGIEADLVPKAGIPLHFIAIGGVRGKNLRTQLTAPLQLLLALRQSWQLIRQLNPVCVLGFGGFAAGPGGVAAWLLRKPLVIHEQNAVPGTTNRVLALLAKRVLLGYPDALSGARVAFVGNPVRRTIAQLAPPEQRWAERSGALRLLVLGGSLGAKPINDVLPAAIAALPLALRPAIWHQTGRGQNDEVNREYRERELTARVEPFITDMAAAYAWADLVVCRAGALTVAELAAAGIGSILVPLPHAIDDHQTQNANWLVEQRAGVLLPQHKFDSTALAKLLGELATQPQELLAWARAARSLATPDAAAQVAQACYALIGTHKGIAYV
jgi:UDP-N-acetylglucosamine--N-acetylmuramyl-(pentapeptide) pyrophosphoryl-undecaprenol N-acetylglucosamine transferase